MRTSARLPSNSRRMIFGRSSAPPHKSRYKALGTRKIWNDRLIAEMGSQHSLVGAEPAGSAPALCRLDHAARQSRLLHQLLQAVRRVAECVQMAEKDLRRAQISQLLHIAAHLLD